MMAISIFMRTTPRLLLGSLCLMVIGACSPPPDRHGSSERSVAAPATAPQGAPRLTSTKSEHFLKQQPIEIQSATRTTGGMCPVDSINLRLAAAGSKSIPVLRTNPFAAEGWAVTENVEKPVPDLLFLVLTSGSDDYFLPGVRTERADVAKGDRRFLRAGFKAAGFLSEVPVGKYRLRIASGDSLSLNLCDSGYEIVAE